MPLRDLARPAAFACALLLGCATQAARSQQAPPDATPEAKFLTENDAAMTTMMNGMTIKPTGDVDQDFAAIMIAHHQGAIDMAQAELRHGKNERLRRIAQEIVVDQIQEIAAMQLAVGKPLSPSRAVPTQFDPASLPAAPPVAIHEHSSIVHGSDAMRRDRSKQ